ncbi:MAG TPA: hypothetical protein VIM12_02455 [Noviherbaspirillum sp.]|uniref:hypothetical protein n=1 Tax=Noviherbaspirillum sp. TaxID=1926288 RepID=UPI002F942006
MDDALILALLFLGMLGIFVQLTILFETVWLPRPDPDRRDDAKLRLPPRGEMLKTAGRRWRLPRWRA